MSIVLQSTGGGSVTIAEPSTASNFTATLPASTGTILTTGTPQSGGVIQMVTATYATQTSTTSTSYVDTGLTATITPKFSTSKILVLSSNYYQSYVTSGNKRDTGGAFQLVRNSTNVWDSGGTVNCYIDGSNLAVLSFNILNLWNLSYVDSPATTSATAYKIQFTAVSSNTMVVNPGGSNAPSTITLLEIAA
jgi:hypothetical protein